jgi:peroxiredoxin Q/BCP
MRLIKTAVLILVFGATVLGTLAVEVGEKAPSIEAMDQDGMLWTLSEHLGDKHLVVYFYPAAMTGGCTKQACAYRDHRKDSDALFDVVGISGDPVQNLKWFQQSGGLNFTLLSDPDGSIAKAFGVPVREGEKSITRTVDGKEVELKRAVTPERWTYVIDPKGKVVYRADKVKPTADLDAVLGFLQAIE